MVAGSPLAALSRHPRSAELTQPGAGVHLPPVSEVRKTATPVGPASNTSMSFCDECAMPLACVTERLVSTPAWPLTMMFDGYGVAARGTPLTVASLIVIGVALMTWTAEAEAANTADAISDPKPSRIRVDGRSDLATTLERSRSLRKRILDFELGEAA